MKKILIVIDMQVDFISGSLGSNDAISILPNVIEKIKNFNGEIIFTRDTHFEDYLQTQEGKKLPVEHCIKDTDGWQIHPALLEFTNEHIYDKITFGAKDLPNIIDSINTENDELSFTLIGLCTDICVINNAMVLKAFYPESVISVAENCCAGVTPLSHKTALDAMKMCQIEII